MIDMTGYVVFWITLTNSLIDIYRGITAISTMQAMVDAMGGKEVCDAFDIIAGTSTGAIIAFLVGLRRESSRQAKKRYEELIEKIFVKSALSVPMLFLTTASYSEEPFKV